jgi:hypothetical protein
MTIRPRDNEQVARSVDRRHLNSVDNDVTSILDQSDANVTLD